MVSTSHQALLLVDGYNIIGAWESLKKTSERDGLESARRDLIFRLTDYIAYQGFITEIVFDSHFQKTPTQKEKYSPTISISYTAFGQTADSYIEKMCAAFSRLEFRPAPRLIVATSDQAQRLTAIGYGAEWLSAAKLKMEIDLTASRLRRKYRPQQKSQGRFLFNRLDPKTQEILSQLRYGNSQKKIP